MPGYKPISYSLRLGQSGICGRQRPQKCEKKGGGLWQVSFILSPLPLPFFPTSAGYMSRINLAESSCHMAITATLAFPSILAILQSAGAQLSYTPPWLHFEVLSLDEDFNPKIWSTFFFLWGRCPFWLCDVQRFQIFHSTKFANGALVMWFSIANYRKLHQYPVIL